MSNGNFLSRLLENIAPLVSIVFIGYFFLVLFIYQSYRNQLDELSQLIDSSDLESQKMLLNSELMELARARTRLTSKIIDTEDVFIQDELNMQLESYAGRFAQHRAELLSLELSPQEEYLLETHPTIISIILPAQRRAVSLAMSEDAVKIAESRELLYSTVLPGQGKLIESFAELIALEKQKITELTLSARQSMDAINNRMFLLVSTTLSMIVLISIVVIARIITIQGRLVDHQKNLEVKVEQRTKELTKANIELEHSLQEIEETQGQLIESEKMSALGTLVAGVAHEVNTPVGISITANSQIKDALEKLDNKFQDDQMKKSDLDDYIHSAKKLNKILTTNLNRAAELISSFKQVSADQNVDDVRTFELCEYLHDIVISVEPQLKRTPHKIRIHCEGDIVINSIPGVYSQVITNLIINSLTHGFDEEYLAIKGEDAKGRINIIASWSEDNSKLIIDYHDTGKGMSDEQARQLFQPFFTTKRNLGGTGLGMFVVYNLVNEKLKGDINCYSQPGEGVQIVIEIPRENLVKP